MFLLYKTKRLIARSLHDHSRRCKGPFVAVNCGAIPENLIESELFGYVAGAFTGANRDKKGLLEDASGGTLFLDEVSELPLNMQVKLLRALQEKEIQRLGANQPIPLDLRICAATHRNLETWVSENKFREDLYYRLAQMILNLPPLRERREDLSILADHFLKLSAEDLELKKAPRLGKDLLQIMMDYSWPGNVRELENMIRTSSAFAERGIIHMGNLPEFLRQKLTKGREAEAAVAAPFAGPATLSPEASTFTLHPDWNWKQYEEALYAKTFLRNGMSAEKTAEDLDVGVATVYVKIRKYGLKSRGTKWEDVPFDIPEDMTVAKLKQQLVEFAFCELQSPYAVAKKLGINVGTVYRFIKEAS